MASGEAINPASEPLQHKTITLKTSIHCPGCSRKVKRIIQRIPGVHNFAIDPSQNKVSITGDVEPGVVIKKFLKSNKQAELWAPEKTTKIPTSTAAANYASASGGGEKNQSEKEIINASNHLSEKKNPVATATATATAAVDGPKAADVAQEVAAKAPSKLDVGPAKSPKSQQESVVPSTDDSGKKKSDNQEGKSGGGDGGGEKKTEKTVQKEFISSDRAVVESSSSAATEGTTSLPPLQQQQNTMYHAPTAASYVMSYNMTQPSTAHSYYAHPPAMTPPPPPPSQGYFYSSYPPPPPPEYFYGMPPEWGSPAPAPPPESYHMFNDENANSCNVM